MRTQACSHVLKIWRGKMHFAVATHSFEICLTRKFLDSTRFGWEEKKHFWRIASTCTAYLRAIAKLLGPWICILHCNNKEHSDCKALVYLQLVFLSW